MKKTKEFYEKVVFTANFLFESGKTVDEIAKILGYKDYVRMARSLNKAGVFKDLYWATDEYRLSKIIEMYKNGMYMVDITKKLNISPATFYKLTCNSEEFKCLEKELKEEKIRSAQKLYDEFLGLLSDGMIVEEAIKKIGRSDLKNFIKYLKHNGVVVEKNHQVYKTKCKIKKMIEMHREGLSDSEIFEKLGLLELKTFNKNHCAYILNTVVPIFGYNPLWFGPAATYVDPVDLNKADTENKEGMGKLFEDLVEYSSKKFGSYNTYEILKQLCNAEKDKVDRIVSSNKIMAGKNKEIILYGVNDVIQK